MSEITITDGFSGRIRWGDSTIRGIRWRVTAAGGKVLQFMTLESWREGDSAGQVEVWADVPEEFMP